MPSSGQQRGELPTRAQGCVRGRRRGSFRAVFTPSSDILARTLEMTEKSIEQTVATIFLNFFNIMYLVDEKAFNAELRHLGALCIYMWPTIKNNNITDQFS